jgi:serine/threonine protein kinase
MTEPNMIGPYEIVSQIGSGGMATVYKAYQRKLDRHVAVKVMHKSFSEDHDFRARFEREAKIVARLDHPNIVPVYDYDDRYGQAYLVMKYVDGVTLKTLLRKATLNPDEILEVMVPIADALTYAHKQGILHRDIKPSNIIINRQSVPYLTDFGLARIAQQGESTMSADVMLGTPHYISPEQAKGQTDLDARTDIYSAGVVLYELAVGRVPFAGENSYAIIHDHIYTPPPKPGDLNPELSPSVEAVLLRALAKDPDDRYETPTAMMEAYRQAVGGEPVVVTQQSEPATSSTDLEEVPTGFISRFVRGMETFGVEMEAAFRDFDKDEYGRKLSEEEMAAKKGEAAFKFKKSVQTALQASGIDVNLTKPDEEERYAAPLSEEERIRARVERRIRKQREELSGLVTHIVIFVIINSWLFGLDDWFSKVVNGQDAGWPHIVTLLWGIGLVSNFLDYFSKYGPWAYRRERMIDREVERERRRLYGESYDYKAKNEDYDGRAVRLTEDGELTESFVDEMDPYNKRKNR